MKRLLLIDIDGVLADCEHRLPYLKNKDYDSFYGVEMMNDPLIPDGKALFQALYDWRDGDRLVYLTSRPERTRNLTLGWLAMNDFPIPGPGLYSDVRLSMRPDGDYRKSEEMKLFQIERDKLLEKGNSPFGEMFYIDDQPQNIEAVSKAYPQITSLLFRRAAA